MIINRMLLRRIASTLEWGTFGNIISPTGVPLCVSLEPPWLNNEKDLSCIPPGIYQCVPHDGPRWKNTWEVTGVTNRAEILFHPGNTLRKTVDGQPQFVTRGCIMPGMSYGQVNNSFGIINSQPAFDMLRKMLPPKFLLEVENCFAVR